MPETKKKMPILGVELSVTDVPISESSELFNRYKLEDGSVVKVKNVVTSIVRIDGQYLPDGRPVYFVFSSPVVDVETSPLTKKVQ
jgi:carbonic anhydrase/acetyltransferase-like protein (isoleucine patch superfamily)